MPHDTEPNDAGSTRRLIQQVCVIPFRRPPDGKPPIEVCLITSLIKKRWIFPKGIIDPGETAESSARTETWEEAGLRGELIGPALGRFPDQKWGCDLDVQVLLMEVHEVAEDWPENQQRQRLWTSLEDALARVKRNELRSFLRLANKRISAVP